ncbi:MULTISPECIES: porin [Marinobacter]|uniref:porin n=1 Tax=Marinobacter TaxID=2742 RepID=UPI000DADE89B|nr:MULTISPECIES: porin [Marinobacter]
MNKNVLSLLVAGAMTVPMAAQAEMNFDVDADLYGSIRAGVNDFSGEDAEFTDELSRLGVKGEVDMGLDDVKGIFHYEGRLRVDTGEFAGSGEDNARLAYAGAKGSWGTVQGGRMWLPGAIWTHLMAGGGFNDVQINDSHNVHHRMPNAITYISPNLGGLQASASAVLGGSGGRIGDSIFGTVDSSNFDDNDENMDIYAVALQYNIGGFHVGATRTSTKLDDYEGDYDVNTVAATYKFDSGISLGGLYQDESNDTGQGSFEDVEIYNGSVQYAYKDTSVRAMYTHQDVDDAENNRVSLGVQQIFGKTRLWLEYADVDSDNGLKYSLASSDLISLGFRVDF